MQLALIGGAECPARPRLGDAAIDDFIRDRALALSADQPLLAAGRAVA